MDTASGFVRLWSEVGGWELHGHSIGLCPSVVGSFAPVHIAETVSMPVSLFLQIHVLYASLPDFYYFGGRCAQDIRRMAQPLDHSAF